MIPLKQENRLFSDYSLEMILDEANMTYYALKQEIISTSNKEGTILNQALHFLRVPVLSCTSCLSVLFWHMKPVH